MVNCVSLALAKKQIVERRSIAKVASSAKPTNASNAPMTRNASPVNSASPAPAKKQIVAKIATAKMALSANTTPAKLVLLRAIAIKEKSAPSEFV